MSSLEAKRGGIVGILDIMLNTERPSRSKRGKLQRRFRDVVKKDV